MEKDYPTTDYAAILADMEAKKTALESAILSLRAALAAGALGISASVPTGSIPTVSSNPLGLPSMTLPRGAFLGKTVTEAIKLYLTAVRKKQTNKEIAQALKEGGLESNGNFDTYINGGLFRLKKEGVVLRFEEGWGLAEWYPESFRVRAEQKDASGENQKGKKKGARKAKAKIPAETARPTPVALGLEQRIEAVLRAQSSTVFKPDEIAKTLGVNAGAVKLSLGRMAAKGKASKWQGGYQISDGNVQSMPKAV